MVGVATQRKRDCDGEDVQMNVAHAPDSGLSLTKVSLKCDTHGVEDSPAAGAYAGIRAGTVLEGLEVEA